MIKFRITQSGRGFRSDIFSDSVTVGNICLVDISDDPYDDRYELIIDLKEKYAELVDEVLRYALEEAFMEVGAAEICCTVKSYDMEALNAYYNAGFSADSENGYITRLSITEKQYYCL